LYSSTHFVLWFALLVLVDGLLSLANAFLPKLVPGHVVPAAFSPTRPPPFEERPVTAAVCWLARTLPQRLVPGWVAEWSVWEGIGHGGDWGMPLAPAEDASRCPCPALNVSFAGCSLNSGTCALMLTTKCALPDRRSQTTA